MLTTPRLILALLLPLSLPPGARAADPAPVDSRQGMVVTAQHLASDVGATVLRQGGNAIDAAVAVGYALAVVYPQAGNLGGGGFMTLRLADGRTTFIDFREKAPLAATEKMFLDKDGQVIPGLSTDSWLAVGTPGSPAGFEYARVKYGSMPRAALMAPAIRLAREGFTIGQGDAGVYQIASAELAKDPIGAKIFFKDGRPLQQGDRLVQPQLAHSLQLISDRGPEAAFYRGPIAAAIVAASHAGGGILSIADFEHYRVRELPPVECDYRGFHLISAPPPSSGGVMICEILQILQGYDLGKMGFHSADEVHFLVESMRRAFADRRDLGDPAFVSNPVAEFLSPAHAAAVRAGIDPLRATPSAALRAPETAPHEGTNTTHFSIVDAAGNAVSVTYTLNNWFGAQRVAGDTGILMNDEMDDFTSKPEVPNMFGLIQGAANAVQPGKTPLSSMSPTIVTKDGRLVMVIGSPGGSRIITITLEAIINVIDHGMTIQEAIDAPRIHHQWLPDTVYLERQALSPDTRALLQSRGYRFSDAGYWGIAEGILVGGPSLAGQAGFGKDDFLPLNARPEVGEIYFGAHDVRGGAGLASAKEGLPVQ
jgi:gamma-glutamyltranspeptidase/glutathione hydrolase